MALMPVCSGSLTGWRSTTPGRLELDGPELLGLDGSLVVERHAERVDDATDESLSYRYLQHTAGALDGVAFHDERVFAQQHRADVVLLEVEHEARDVVRQLEHLGHERIAQAVDAGDAVTDFQHRADLVDLDLGLIVLDLGLQDRGDLFGAELHFDVTSQGRPSRVDGAAGGCGRARWRRRRGHRRGARGHR